METMTRVLLRQLESSFGVSITGARRQLDSGEESWTLEATSADTNRRWRGTAPDEYQAACALAEALGFELNDG